MSLTPFEPGKLTEELKTHVPDVTALNDLVKQLSTYGFTDPLGHPLHNCAEFTELVRRATKAVTHV